MAGAGRCLFLKIFFLRMLSLDWPRPESRLTDCVGGLGFESEPDSCFCLRAAARTCLWSLSEPLENFLFLRNKNRDFCILTIKLPEHTNKLCDADYQKNNIFRFLSSSLIFPPTKKSILFMHITSVPVRQQKKDKFITKMILSRYL